MIDLLTNEQLRDIAGTHGPGCTSLYLPTHRAGPEVQQDPIRLKNLLAAARREMAEMGLGDDVVASRTEPAAQLLRDDDFWARGEHGLAVLLGPGGMLTHRMGSTPEELVVVSDRFHIKPLLGSVTSGAVFWILSLSQNRVRLLRGGPAGAAEVALEDIPESLAAALWFEDRERQLQSHGATRVGRGKVSATFHGQGLGKDTQHADLARFLRAVDAGVSHVVEDPAQPIVLCGVERDLAAFREVSRNPSLVDGVVPGNCDRMSPTELHEAAWPVVRTAFAAERERVAAAIGSSNGRSEHDLGGALTAARDGRVESLIVALGVQRWGVVGDDGDVAVHDTRGPGDRDLLDALVLETMLHGGGVHAVEPQGVPGGGELAALLRW